MLPARLSGGLFLRHRLGGPDLSLPQALLARADRSIDQFRAITAWIQSAGYFEFT